MAQNTGIQQPMVEIEEYMIPINVLRVPALAWRPTPLYRPSWGPPPGTLKFTASSYFRNTDISRQGNLQWVFEEIGAAVANTVDEGYEHPPWAWREQW